MASNPNFHLLGGGFNPFEKYDRQIGSFPQGSGMKIPKIFELPPPSYFQYNQLKMYSLMKNG